jgi:uncharacterized coiled-coil protein SlyX
LAVTVSGALQAATDEERIRRLEEMVERQQRTIEILGTELQKLQQDGQTRNVQVEDLSRALLPAPAAVKPSPDKEGTSPLSVNVYGFAQADAIYDFKRVDPNWNDTLRVTTIPTDSGTYGEDGEMVFGVRQSRLGIKGAYGEDVTYILEAELFGVGGDEGQTTPRLRHAWATYKNFGMGQYWSNFMDIDIFPNTIDYWGPTGMVFYRNKQARYTFPMGEDEFAISLEDPDTAITVGQFRDVSSCDLPNSPPDCESVESGLGDLVQAYNDLPDLSVRYRNNGDFGQYQVAGMVRKLGYERLDTGTKDEEYGWGINTSAGLQTWGKDVLKLQLVYGEGIGNYMNDGGVDIAPDSADINTTGVEAVGLLGVSAYYDRYWNERWSTTIGWSMTDLDTTDGQVGTEFDKGQIAQINLLHYPVDNVLMGTEFSWGEREDVNGNTEVNFDTGDLMGRR